MAHTVSTKAQVSAPAVDDVLGAWHVTRADAGGLSFTAPSGDERRATLKKAVTVLGSVALGVVVAFDPRLAGAESFTWPFAGLLFLVAGIGVASTWRSARRWRHGVRLEVDGARRTVTGSPLAGGDLSDFHGGPLTVPLAEVEAVALCTYPDKDKTRLALEVRLSGGQRLQGPDVEPAPEHLAEVRARLVGAGEALARLCGRSLVHT